MKLELEQERELQERQQLQHVSRIYRVIKLNAYHVVAGYQS